MALRTPDVFTRLLPNAVLTDVILNPANVQWAQPYDKNDDDKESTGAFTEMRMLDGSTVVVMANFYDIATWMYKARNS